MSGRRHTPADRRGPGRLRPDQRPPAGRQEAASRVPSSGSRSAPGPAAPYWLGGRRTAMAAVRSGRAVRVLLAEGAHGLDPLRSEAAGRGIPVGSVARPALHDLAGEDAQGCAVLVPPLSPTPLSQMLAAAAREGASLLLALDHLQDPRNLGAAARTLEAVGGLGLVFPRHRSVGVTPAAERTAAGGFEALAWDAVHNLPQALLACRRAGFWVFGAAPEGDAALGGVDWAPRSVLVMGAEGRGLSPLVRGHCDRLVSLPMRGQVESLNASAAAAVLLYDWWRWDARRGAPLTSQSDGR